MLKILLTGSEGQVGQILYKKLYNKSNLLAVNHKELDITNKSEIENIVFTFKPDVIINAAAYTAVDNAENNIETAKAVNVQGPQNLAQVAQKIDAILLHISTDYVFDGKSTLPYTEEMDTNPLNVYGRTKLEGEIAVLQNNPRSIILRTSWVFSEFGNNFVKVMLKLGKERNQLNIVSDQIGAPTYAGDIADTLIKIAFLSEKNKKIPFGIYHFSGYPYTNWFEFAKIIFQKAVEQNILERSPKVLPISSGEYPTVALRPLNSCLKLDKIKENFDINPSDWQNALLDMKRYIE
ncbi:dTDP-4-dehydrorhamnose reductase [Pasteurella sp. PK-2025]|uniref:dTDP-4-dehydrorhamnose reductase n=1 Tax=Pasteurella sp. PK-2025 TaxID=3413133 RepID=UPI003C7801BA